MNRYEELRGAALASPEARHAVGLFVFGRDGMMVWLQTLAPLPVTAGLPVITPLPSSILPSPPALHDDVVQVLANMVLRDPCGGRGGNHEPGANHA